MSHREKNRYSAYFFDYFDTATIIVGYEYTESEFNSMCSKISELLGEYHKLYDIYHKYDGVNNLYTVNSIFGSEHGEITVDKRVIDLIEFSKDMYNITNGYTNIAMGSVLSVWHDYREYGTENPRDASLPPMETLKTASEHCDIERIVTDKEKNTVLITDPYEKIDVGAVAKGYAVERVAEYLESENKSGYIINVGGNIRTVGRRADGNAWKIGIENPDSENGGDFAEYLEFCDKALVTSGSYQRYYSVDGVRYHHIIDPETLMPKNTFLSVSVLTDDSGVGDALSTALFSMDYETGLALIERLENVEAMWIRADGEKLYSSGFKDYVTGK